jgi:hypothetical protein
MKLWTTYSEYGATGEGVTLMAYLGYADTPAEAKAAFTELFGELMTAFCHVEEGVSRNAVTMYLFSAEALGDFERHAGRHTIRVHASVHVNSG